MRERKQIAVELKQTAPRCEVNISFALGLLTPALTDGVLKRLIMMFVLDE